jgi:transcription elongation factor GreA-like protein
MSKEYCYLVYYDYGSHGDYSQVELFVTKDFEVAKKYIDKFNAMLSKWEDYYNKLYIEDFSERIGNRFYKLQEINKATITKVEFR